MLLLLSDYGLEKMFPRVILQFSLFRRNCNILNLDINNLNFTDGGLFYYEEFSLFIHYMKNTLSDSPIRSEREEVQHHVFV